MSTGKTKAMKRVRPAANNSHYGLSGFVGAAFRGELGAYTYEHYERDVAEQHISAGSRDCPRGNPERDCTGSGVNWRRIRVLPARKPTKKDPYPRPRRIREHIKMICEDCRVWLWLKERWDFYAEYGHYRLEDGPLDVARTKDSLDYREVSRAVEAASTIFRQEARALEQLVGLLDDPFPEDLSVRVPQAKMLLMARHCLSRFASPISGRTAIRTSTPE